MDRSSMPQQPGGAEPRPAAAPRSGLRPAPRRGTPSSLVNRNVFVGKRRTSLRLEPAMWDALAEICRRE
ncbi:MAG TPA: ribbon-helix-helix domain-containing protein, partial [Kiloniellales bacterium]|nr:ribbon-helix-helix domain-containing protein [Kiloniellales bacterium]